LRADRIKELVKEYYSKRCMVELRRLGNDPYHRLEYDTTMHFLKRYLPKRGSVLDAGGGPGSYTIGLAKMGYEVTLLDLTPKLLKIADELIRVAKCNAPIFVSVIGRLAILMNTIVYLWPELKKAPHVWRKYVTTGDYFGGYGFTACHFYIPMEFRAEFEGRARIAEMIGLEGIFSTHSKEYNKVHKMRKYNDILWNAHLRTCTYPSVVEISEHFMMICKKL